MYLAIYLLNMMNQEKSYYKRDFCCCLECVNVSIKENEHKFELLKGKDLYKCKICKEEGILNINFLTHIKTLKHNAFELFNTK